jgi:hypothetical protein
MSTVTQGKNAAVLRRKTGWDEAIADAKRKIKELSFSIAVFRARKKAGEPWPGESATHN